MNGEPAVEKVPPVKRRKDSHGGAVTKSSNAPQRVNGKAEPPVLPAPASRRAVRSEDVVVEDEGFGSRQSHMNYELRDSPGLGELLYIYTHY